jgi:hypothetical protein
MDKSQDELSKLTEEVKQLSTEIASMKSKASRMDDSAEKQQLLEEIKTKQWQVLFYIEKMENLSKPKA